MSKALKLLEQVKNLNIKTNTNEVITDKYYSFNENTHKEYKSKRGKKIGISVLIDKDTYFIGLSSKKAIKVNNDVDLHYAILDEMKELKLD